MKFIFSFLLWASFICQTIGQSFSLVEATISDIQNSVEAGDLTYEDLVGLYFNRVGEYDYKVHSVLQLNPSAVIDAAALDMERKEEGLRGPLHGIPVLLKDLIDQKGFATTGGNIAMQNCMPPDDSTVVKRLEAAGAVILGKVSLSEFALSFGRLGYSSLGGTVLNPYDPMLSASGSSSGSAAAVAANFAIFALGSDTVGSIRGPASSTELVGIKPTRGLVSLDGVIPLSDWADVVGPLARTVEDAAKVLGALTGVDENDPRTQASKENFLKDYTPFLKRGTLSGVKLGRIVGFSGGNADVDALFNNALADIESLGATVVEVNFTEYISDPELLGGVMSGWSILGEILDDQCEQPVDDYLTQGESGCPKDLAMLTNWSMAYSDTLNAMNPARLAAWETCLQKSNSTTAVSKSSSFSRLTEQVVPSLEKAVLDVMSTLGLKRFVYPSMLCPSRPTWNNPDPKWTCDASDQWVTAYFANIVGWPDVTIPMGFTETSDFPMGLQILGPKWSESTLLGFAYDYEQETMYRRPPKGFGPLPGDELLLNNTNQGSPESSNSASNNGVEPEPSNTGAASYGKIGASISVAGLLTIISIAMM